jgi:hypothetical protein
MNLQAVALGAAGMEADHRVREEGGNNRGPRVRTYLLGIDPPISTAAPWCAAFVQYCSDVAARTLGVPNPLDAVRLEAYVQSYADEFQHQAVGIGSALAGDLVLYSFGGERWDHIGFFSHRGDGDVFWVVEGNTSLSNPRDGGGVALKARDMSAGDRDPIFIRWGSPPE